MWEAVVVVLKGQMLPAVFGGLQDLLGGPSVPPPAPMPEEEEPWASCPFLSMSSWPRNE